MHGSIRLGTIAGISIDLHFTWFIIFAVVALVITAGLPGIAPGIPPGLQWGLGIGVALVFFASLVLHELAHSLVAKRLGIGISGITLFIFGGVSRMTSEPKSAGDELKMAIVGPATSALLGVVFLALWVAAVAAGAAPAVRFGLHWLGLMNLFLAGFNLLPGFPLDGGRVLRAIIWSATGDLRHATYIASTAGQGVAYSLMAAGILALFGRIPRIPAANGWLLLVVGWFLLDAARSSYQQQVLRSALSGVRVRDMMTPEVVTVPPDVSLQQAVDEYFLRLNHAAFPVTEGPHLAGMLSLAHVRQVPREQWGHTRVADVVERLDQSHFVRPGDDAWEALAAMAGADRGRLLVVEGTELVGIISRTNIMRFLRTKIELGV
ncbi:MAG TPA: site-2 protease family protein [Armatimonadota bacterium]|nr:site-2 protease family protein [Armatimonadota bacterium]